ncbi:CG18259 [Drosophila busckii]|uniref:CG18259 n=1 Tax=Drosophila busckii TaxID=30019 RepID=A0A0M3QZ32_DROBS|nr:uncharacterized protein LOC108606446 [Drosophila busckii]ALC48723.1 CG18259 [Drosophila busckii]
MDVDLSLDEIIERKRHKNPHKNNDKKIYNANLKTRKTITKPPQPYRTFDARNKIIEKTRAKIFDAREILNHNFSLRENDKDARHEVLVRQPNMSRPMKPQRSAMSESRLGISGGGRGRGGVHKGRFGQRIITMGNRPGGGVVQTLWDPNDEPASRGYKPGGSAGGGAYTPSRLNAGAKPFVPRGYVDHDNMQQLEDEEIARTLHLNSYSNSLQSVGGGRQQRMGRNYIDYDMDVESVEIQSQSVDNDPFAIYEAARNRVSRPTLPPMPPPPPPYESRVDNGEPMFERRQRNMVASSNLPESLRARLFGSEPDRRVSHGIYANENGSSDLSKTVPGLSSLSMRQRRSPPLPMGIPLPLSSSNNKPGYRLLVSNLCGNVTTSDIRELFNDIGPMYDAHVVRPGTAEVIYKSLEHAEMAVDAYHQREFDGQPMHCVLVNPHSSNRSTHSVSARTVTTNSSGVEVDIDALHSVLFRDR